MGRRNTGKVEVAIEQLDRGEGIDGKVELKDCALNCVRQERCKDETTYYLSRS